MGNSAVNDILMEEEEETETKNNNSFPETITKMGNTLFRDYPEKTSNLSAENINGIIRARVLNNYMAQNFGYEYEAINELIKNKQIYVVSEKGFGVASLIEFVKSIQATFEQTQLPSRVKDLLGR